LETGFGAHGQPWIKSHQMFETHLPTIGIALPTCTRVELDLQTVSVVAWLGDGLSWENNELCLRQWKGQL
jgi:hypothetical protein